MSVGVCKQNVLPPTGVTADVVIYIDSVSIVCQSAVAGGTPMPTPVACVEVGEHHTLPGLTLRFFLLELFRHLLILSPFYHAENNPENILGEGNACWLLTEILHHS